MPSTLLPLSLGMLEKNGATIQSNNVFFFSQEEKMKKNRLLLLLSIFMISACTTIQVPPSQTTPTDEILLPSQTSEGSIDSDSPEHLPTEEPTPSTKDVSEFTYQFDQQKIDLYCMQFPQTTVYKPIITSNGYLVPLSTDLIESNIFTVSVDEGVITPLFTPEFRDGHVFLRNLAFEHPWYIYMVVDSRSETGDWTIHAVNLDENSNTIIANNEQFNSLATNTYISLDAGKLYFSTSTFDGTVVLSSALYQFDLVSNEKVLLTESQNEQTYMANIAASTGYIVIENMVPKEPSRGLTLFDVSNQSWLELPQGFPASMPAMEFPYIIWKNDESNANPTSFTVFNLDSSVSKTIPVVGKAASDLTLSKGFVVLQASTGKENIRNSVVLYSLEGGNTYAIQIGMDELNAYDAYIANGNVIWAFTTLASADNYSSYICSLPLEEVFANAVEGIELPQ